MAQECSRCILNDQVPGVRIEPGGQCSVCTRHDVEFATWEQDRDRRKAELERLLESARAAHRRYDVIVPLSGGKDSTYVLWLAREVHGLRTLAVTYDNGFLTDHARRNITRAVDALGADHVTVRLAWPLQQALYRHFFLKTGFFCPACMSGIEYAIATAAASHRVPLVLKGTSKRTEEHVAPEFFVPSSPDLYRAVVEGEEIGDRSPIPRGVSWRQRIGGKLPLPVQVRWSWGTAINLPDYLEWNYDHIFKTIRDELGWEARVPDAEHGDCSVEPAVNYIRRRKYPAVVPELTRFAKLVTIGQMSREEAKRKVAEAGGTGEPTEALRTLLAALDLDRTQLEAVLADPMRHLPYLSRHYGVKAGLRKVVAALTLRTPA